MKKYLAYLFGGLFLTCFSCSNEDDNASVGNQDETTQGTKSAGSVQNECDPVAISGTDIEFYDAATGELEFVQPGPREKLEGMKKIEFSLDGKRIFPGATFIPDLMSNVINDLVLESDLQNRKMYLRDGYPSLENLGSSAEKCRKEREANRQLRSPDWEFFLNWLEANGKLVKGEEPAAEGQQLLIKNSENQTMFTGNDIEMFDAGTGELILNDPTIAGRFTSGIRQLFTFGLDGKTLFAAKALTPVSSNIENDLVFYFDAVENKIFLLDGYPEIDVIGSSRDQCREARLAKKQERAEGWKLFIDWLDHSGKLSN